MNIKRAKNEIKNSVRAYLAKDERGEYLIPSVRQRPILLIGPPGIGKTAIMEQVARECGVALLSYTITHHTRQSAVGLPFIEKTFYDGKEYSVTEYTMSEIVAAVYEKIRASGLDEGILFIDEINCVSETLAPTMLQFLQCKTFGNHKIPEGWVIVTAGNPPEYNKSVREFDIVTLDRVKRMEVSADYEVWKEYAYEAQIHGAVLSYLELKKDNFYDVRTTVDGKIFVTARGWEDLSNMLYAYEKLGIPVDMEFISEYLQHPKIAQDFANYYDLYRKYKDEYHIEDILAGKISREAVQQVKAAGFDERFSIVAHLISGLTTRFAEADYQDHYIREIYDMVVAVKKVHEKSGEYLRNDVDNVARDVRTRFEMQKEAGVLSPIAIASVKNALGFMSEMALQDEFEDIRQAFNERKKVREQILEETSACLEHTFDFMEEAFGEEQELVMFVTELSMNSHAVRFIAEEGCPRYQRYLALYLTDDAHTELMGEIEALDEV